jgi:hypothetical protein
MSSFDDRKDAFEKKYAHDQEMAFKAEARCSKLFGLWVAEQLGMTGDDAAAYAKTVVAANLDEPGFDDVKRKVVGDLKNAGKDLSDHVLNVKLNECLAMAREQLMKEVG